MAEQQLKIIFDREKNVTSCEILFFSAFWIWVTYISNTARQTTFSNTFSTLPVLDV
jgi:hypothetical protein